MAASSLKLQLLVKQQWRCALCHGLIERAEHANIDHLVPRSRGGSSARYNLQATHIRCNTRKGNRLPGEQHRDAQKRPEVAGECVHAHYPVPVDLFDAVRCEICSGPTDLGSIHKDAAWLRCRRCGEITRALISKLLADARRAGL